ncbi:hypothetical protein ACFPM3_01255 [Streptomyces coeruleoprunus]|uniref:GNAT family N-acetyltransferase n=1 Tax=Streptomyces coeruleoprunus TaxID=285563 RepID=A0ABV9X5M1_9ACTN
MQTTAAARNNAEWCAAMCRAHGLAPGTFTDRAWTSADRTPPYYPDAVSLAPDAGPDDVLTGVDTTPGCSVKDSFATLDLTDHGFTVLFDAQWIHRPAGLPVSRPTPWQPVRTPAALADWEAAWSDGEPMDLFRPGLLDTPGTYVLAGHDADGAVTGGAVVTHAAGAVGVSNLFGPPDEAWPAVLAFAAERWPGTPVVGYEHGDDLAAALRHGFAPAGPLRIWLAQG